MTNTSASGGYLLPVDSGSPLYDDAFEDFLQEIVVGLTGLPREMVRPRWQPEPGNMPMANADWCAIGIREFDADTYQVGQMQKDGSFETLRHETNDVMASFYGPHATRYAALMRDGIQLDQNREALREQGVLLQVSGTPTRVPSLVKEKWQNRVDLPVTFRRQIRREYRVLSVLTADVRVNGEGHPLIVDDINVTQTP